GRGGRRLRRLHGAAGQHAGPAAGVMHPAFPLPDTGWEPTRPFWEGAARRELVLPRCDRCRGWVWYPPQCRACGGDALTWTPVSGRGRVFSWTVVRHAFLPQFAAKVPFAPGLVALEEDPAVRLVTELVDCDVEELRVDLPVEVVFRPVSFPGVDGQVVAPL